MAAAAETRLGAAPRCRGGRAATVTLRAVHRDEDQPRDHYALQTAIYINALIMVYADYRT